MTYFISLCNHALLNAMIFAVYRLFLCYCTKIAAYLVCHVIHVCANVYAYIWNFTIYQKFFIAWLRSCSVCLSKFAFTSIKITICYHNSAYNKILMIQSLLRLLHTYAVYIKWYPPASIAVNAIGYVWIMNNLNECSDIDHNLTFSHSWNNK